MLRREHGSIPDSHEMSQDDGVDVRYSSPAEQPPEEEPLHRFEIVKGDETIGGGEIEYFSRPLPLYQLSDLWVDDEHSGRGNASLIMDRVEGFLEKRGKPGLLVDAIIPGSKAYGMYERRGWEAVPSNPYLRVYNWPQDVPLDVLRGYAMRQTPMEDREGFTAESIN